MTSQIDTRQSRQLELEIKPFYVWAPYWGIAGMGPVAAYVETPFFLRKGK